MLAFTRCCKAVNGSYWRIGKFDTSSALIDTLWKYLVGMCIHLVHNDSGLLLLVYVCRVQDLQRGTQCTSFLSFLVLIVITPRTATDLKLHQVSTTQPQTERQEREMLNRARLWMICFNIDR
jgi:hypothetical protein